MLEKVPHNSEGPGSNLESGKSIPFGYLQYSIKIHLSDEHIRILFSKALNTLLITFKLICPLFRIILDYPLTGSPVLIGAFHLPPIFATSKEKTQELAPKTRLALCQLEEKAKDTYFTAFALGPLSKAQCQPEYDMT